MNKIFIIVALIAFSAASCNRKISTVSIDNHIISVNVANTQSQREQGLSGRQALGADSGMLFVFDTPGIYGFWMKDMNFPIDILWLDQDYKIVYIEKSVSPSTYPKVFYPDSLSRYVLEIPSGQSKLLNIKIGDIVKFVRM